MKVQRFVATDMRTALRDVRAELGAEAVILSNRKVDGLVEILAARDFDEELMNEAFIDTRIQNKPDSAAAYYENAARQAQAVEAQENDSVSLSPASLSPARKINHSTSYTATPSSATLASATAAPVIAMQFDPGISQMRDELK